MSDLTVGTIQQIAAMAMPQVIASTLPGGKPSVLVPDGWECAVLPVDDKLAEHPRRVTGTIKVFDAASFIQYFQDYKNLDSRIFADDSASSVTAVLDYHEDNNSTLDGIRSDEMLAIMPHWCEHRLQLALRKSEEWTLWTGSNTRRMSQDDFARFLEDNAPDLATPDPATMLEIARGMSVTKEISVETAVRTNKGATFRYNEVVKAGGLGPAGEFQVPDEFTIKVPIYLGSPAIEVRARLRYQIGGGKLTLWYDLWRWQNVERESFRAIRGTIADATELVIINGTPAA